MRGPQLNIRGLTVDEIKEFDAARKGIGPEGSDLTRRIFLKMIFREWKNVTVQQPQAVPAGGAAGGRGRIVAEGPIPLRESSQKHGQPHRARKSG